MGSNHVSLGRFQRFKNTTMFLLRDFYHSSLVDIRVNIPSLKLKEIVETCPLSRRQRIQNVWIRVTSEI